MSSDTEDKMSEFMREVADVTPLHQDKIRPWKPRHRPMPIEREQLEDEEPVDFTTKAPLFLQFRRSGIQHRVFSDLKRGVIQPEDTLDLHGVRLIDAKKMLNHFLTQSSRRGLRCVRIIHGKGKRSESLAVLKQGVNHWLPQRPEVLAYISAPNWDGGTGAVYVLLSMKFRRS